MRGLSRPFSEVDAGAEYMRQHFPLQFGFHVSRPLEVSQERPADFYHLYYDTMIADPVAEMRCVYGWLGDDWTPDAEAGMRRIVVMGAVWTSHNGGDKFGTGLSKVVVSYVLVLGITLHSLFGISLLQKASDLG